jgi:diaminohydroxyphosphoribosylaminopyrimidine deaminase/5-amino-6-(5-phosphoribosylamino)uracil reductase
MLQHEMYMRRCLELASLGQGFVAPNPLVGAVLVHHDQIISEGYHRFFGGAHAEVDCLSRVSKNDYSLISLSTMYVSLEPCSHTGKTPPCVNAIIQSGIRKVVIAMRDPNPLVNGKGIEMMRNAGVEVVEGVLEKEAEILNERFLQWHLSKRPWVVLKWAESKDGKVGTAERKPIKITHAATDKIVHRWRSEESSILVGTTTAKNDNPSLTNRLWTGASPIRMIIDRDLSLSSDLNLFDGATTTIVFTLSNNTPINQPHIKYIQLKEITPSAILDQLYSMNVPSVLVEGGPTILQLFIDFDCWNEARVFSSKDVLIPGGLPAPILPDSNFIKTIKIGPDTINFYRR